MIKIENVDVCGWEASIRGMYDGKGVRQVYNHFEQNPGTQSPSSTK